MNVFTAVLSGLKGLNEAKTSFGQEDVKKSATNLIIVRQYPPKTLSRFICGFVDIESVLKCCMF